MEVLIIGVLVIVLALYCLTIGFDTGYKQGHSRGYMKGYNHYNRVDVYVRKNGEE